MARLNHRDRTVALKIVYYGPGLCGKTTNLVQLHSRYPSGQRGDMVRLDTETERTLFFDYFPARLGKLGGHTVKANFFTVPGQSFYNQTRRIVVEGCDGLVFVADSDPDREEANIYALENLNENLLKVGINPEDLPTVFQWNKRDVPGAIPIKLLESQLNPRHLPSNSAIAVTGEGVWETQKNILAATLKHVRGSLGLT